jgi:Sulfotransferase family
MAYRRAVHIHIPKTAGTSVTRYMRSLFGNKRVIHFGRRDKTAQFRQLQAGDLMKYRCVGGHLTYPVLREKIGPDALYFTILRDPFDLYMSYYSDIKHRKSHPLHDKANQLTCFSFFEYVTKGNILRSQVSYLSAESSLNQAIELIGEKKIFAETLPHVKDLLDFIAGEFSKKPAALPRSNASQGGVAPDDTELRKAVREFYRDDHLLVAHIDENRTS